MLIDWLITREFENRLILTFSKARQSMRKHMLTCRVYHLILTSLTHMYSGTFDFDASL